MALGVGGLVGGLVSCVDTDPRETPTAIEVPLQRRAPSGTNLEPLAPDVQGETIERATPEPARPIPNLPQR